MEFRAGDTHRSSVVKAVWLFCGGMLSLALLAAAAPPAFAGAVTFSPARVAQGDLVNVNAKPRKKARQIYLSTERSHGKSDVKLGGITAHKPTANLAVPLSTHPGKYYVIACVKRNCKSSKKRLTVIKRGHKKYRYELLYNHSDSRDHTETENEIYSFIGTTTYQQNFRLKSRIKLKGDADGKPAKGTGPIRYTKAFYKDVQTGRWSGQYGSANSPQACHGTSTAILTSTTSGTAKVLGLSIRGSKISLDFRPGTIFSSTTVTPSETIKYDDEFSGCYEGHEVHQRNYFLGDFGNFYNSLNPVAQLVGTSTDRYVHLAKGWKLRKGSGHVFATLKVSGRLIRSEPNSNYTDTYEIDRYPVR